VKKILFCLILIIPFISFAQIGIKAGLNFANITNADEINNSSRTGYNAGIFLAGSYKKVIGSHTEFLYSRQGYDFATNTNTGHVDLDYFIFPQFMAINITKFVQIQAGGYLAYLLNAKVDSTSTSTGDQSVDKILSLTNRFDYGFGGGVEVHPVNHLIVGIRLNLSLGKLYKEPEIGEEPSFIPKVDVRNNLFQIYAGYKLGKE
jgi:hypothetical protein